MKLLKLISVLIIAVILFFLAFRLLPSRFTEPFGTAFSKKDLLLIPKMNDQLLSGQSVEHQWEEQDNLFVLTVTGNIELRSAPTANAAVVKVLGPGVRTRIIYQNPTKVMLDDETAGHWVFLADEAGKEPLGWTVDFNLGYQNRFTPVSYWDIGFLSFCKGDFCGEATVDGNGRFVMQWSSRGEGIYMKGSQTGQLKRFQNIIYLQEDRPDGFLEFFLLSGNNQIHHEKKYEIYPIQSRLAQ